jgi:hypothetical protein
MTRFLPKTYFIGFFSILLFAGLLNCVSGLLIFPEENLSERSTTDERPAVDESIAVDGHLAVEQIADNNVVEVEIVPEVSRHEEPHIAEDTQAPDSLYTPDLMPDIVAVPEIQTKPDVSAHRRHINIWDFGRGLPYIRDAKQRAAAYDFFASRVDVAEDSDDGGIQRRELRARNPKIKLFRYMLDMTGCQHDSCIDNRPVSREFDNLPEEVFLHFSENTTLRFGNKVIEIKGCPDIASIRKECRVQTYIWTDYRWIFNQKSLSFRKWMTEKLKSAARDIEGIFLDEHGPGLTESVKYRGRNDGVVVSGGAILEYGGKDPWQSDAEYNQDLVANLAHYRKELAPRFVVINGATWSQLPLVLAQSLAAGGVVTEIAHVPDFFDSAQQYEEFLQMVDTIVQDGGLVDLYGQLCRTGPSNYATAGNYSSAAVRYRMWRLASYYMAREMEGASGTVYFNPAFCTSDFLTDPLKFIDEWLPAYEVDIGLPDEPRNPTYQKGKIAHCPYVIFSRSFNSGQVLVLVRPRDEWNCKVYDNSTAVKINLPSPMRLLQGDGTWAAPSTSISLLNADAAILAR